MRALNFGPSTWILGVLNCIGFRSVQSFWNVMSQDFGNGTVSGDQSHLMRQTSGDEPAAGTRLGPRGLPLLT